MTSFEDYAEQSNLAHEIYGKRETGFGTWLVDNMPKTEREVEAMRKAWEAGGFFAINTVEEMFGTLEVQMIERIQSDKAEIKALKRLRDDLHETTNRYLERARKAESVVRYAIEIEGVTISLQEFISRCQTGRYVVFSIEKQPMQSRQPSLFEKAAFWGACVIAGVGVAMMAYGLALRFA